ncbi:MAG: hypothetical protein EOO06_19325 [Chitinophagaceae bacterium]|nr:MAG: hypothetical protein EOO06_19325 [Chitinophagaceae bacterium]
MLCVESKRKYQKHGFCLPHSQSIPLYVVIVKSVHYLLSMGRTSTRHYHRVGEVKRIHILMLKERGCTISQIAHQTKVRQRTVEAVLHKRKQHHTIQDLPKTGRPSILDDRTKRRLARMALRGDVKTATELAKTAAALDIAHISQRTARRVLHDEGLKAMHTIKKPLLTRTHKRKRLDFALTHRDWTVQQWKQVIFSDETTILARPSDTHKLKWVKPTHGLNPKLIIPTVQGGGVAILVWGCISTI